MSPALLILLMLAGTLILLAAIAAAVSGTVPWEAAAGLGLIGAAIETSATMALVKKRREKKP